MYSLASTLCRNLDIHVRVPLDPYTSQYSSLMVVISWIYFLPLDWRKLLVDFCRIQVPILQNESLSQAVHALSSPIVETLSQDGLLMNLNIHDLAARLDQLSYSPLLCSMLAYFARAESTIYKKEFEEEKSKSLDKEWLAAIDAQTVEQRLDYTHLFSQSHNGRLHPQLEGQMPTRLAALWDVGFRNIRQRFSRVNTAPILPSYNARKNVAYSTQRAYYKYTTEEWDNVVDEIDTSVTTLELLRLYYRTGHQVTGPLEVRQAWFYNDLKPRTYYCLGGTDYWNGLYIQEIANMFCAILPSTNPETCFTVERLGSLSSGDLLVTYDYTSFTTNLSELRYFLFWLSEACRGLNLDILDVRDGVLTKDLGEVLATYNEEVNHYQPFTMERFQKYGDLVSYRQGRNGSLGVKGNIVFSKTLHGLSLADVTGTPDNDLCVGDDALAIIFAYTLLLFISCTNNLGEINPTKYTTLEPAEPPKYAEQQYKFLKRPLNVTSSGQIIMGTLTMFPNVAAVLFPQGDGIHTCRDGESTFYSARTFAMQWGRFLRLFYRNPQYVDVCLEDDLEFVIGSIRAGYRQFGLPIEGSVPGQFRLMDAATANVKTGTFYVPPCDSLSVFTEDWMQVLLHRMYGVTVSVPIQVGGTIPPPDRVVEGSTFTATSDVQVLRLMEDLQLVESELLLEYRVFDEAHVAEMLVRLEGMGDEKDELLLRRYTVLEVPIWYSDSVYHLFDVQAEEDPEEAWERISVHSGLI